MRTFLKSLVGVGGVALACLLLAPVAHAQCPDASPTAHGLGSAFTGLPEGEFSGLVFVLNSPDGINNGGAQFFCRAEGELSANGFCSFIAGSAVDGKVFINGDWGSPGVFPAGATGCPPGTSPGASPNVAFVTSIQDEGLVSHNGVYVLSSVGFEYNQGWWLFDLAQLSASGDLADLGASDIPKPQVTDLNPDPPVAGPVQVSLSWNRPTAHSDCIPQNPTGSCPEGSRDFSVGVNIYRMESACNTPPTTGRAASWAAHLIATLTSNDPPEYLDTISSFNPSSCYYYAIGLLNGGHVGAVSAHSTVGSGDRDGDGVSDSSDNCPDDPNPGQENGDGDFVGDACDNCPTATNQGQEDDDDDGLGNACDNCEDVANPMQTNSDADSLGDDCDNCRTVTNENQSDVESDGVGDACDNCADVANGNQADVDGDGDGDVCDNCPSDANADQSDVESDGFGDVCDNCPADFNLDQLDGDFDGVGDACDTCPLIPNPTQDPNACLQAVVDLVIDFQQKAALLTWNTTTETDIDYFNVVQIVKGVPKPLNMLPIPCQACEDGRPGSYSFMIPNHKNYQSFRVQLVRTNGEVVTYGPPVLDNTPQ